MNNLKTGMAAEVGRESTCVGRARQKDVVYGERDVTGRTKGLERASNEAEVWLVCPRVIE